MISAVALGLNIPLMDPMMTKIKMTTLIANVVTGPIKEVILEIFNDSSTYSPEALENLSNSNSSLLNALTTLAPLNESSVF